MENFATIEGPYTTILNERVNGTKIKGIWLLYDTPDVAAAIAYTDGGQLKITRRNNSKILSIEDVTDPVCGGCGFGAKPNGYLDVPFEDLRGRNGGITPPFLQDITRVIEKYRAR